MEKIGNVMATLPDIIKTDGDSRKKRPEISRQKDRNQQKVSENRNVFLARDQLYILFNQTINSDESEESVPGNESVEKLKKKSDVLLDLGTLDDTANKKEDSLRYWAHYKIGLAKTLHNYDVLYSKFYRDLMKDILAMNKAANLAFSSPKQLMDSMKCVMSSMKLFIDILQPMAKVMGKMNEVNMNIMKLGKEIGPDGAGRVFTDLSDKIKEYHDLPQDIRKIGRNSDKPEEELMTGKFYQDWSGQCLMQGIETLQYAKSSIEKNSRKLKDLSSINNTANTIKMRKGNDKRTFSLPATFAVSEKNEEMQNKKFIDEIDNGVLCLKKSGLMDIDTSIIMKDDFLKDPYIINSESLAKAAIHKDITGLDETQKVTNQIHSSMF